MPYNAKTNWRNNDIVTPEDLNRIEKGIADSASPDASITFYVSPSGDDTAGTGEEHNPFRSIQKAIDSFPSNNSLGKSYSIELQEGEYTGFRLAAFKAITINVSGEVQITGNITISEGRLTFMGDAEAGITVVNGRIVMGGGDLTAMITLGVTYLDTTSNSNAIDCSSGAKFTSTSDVIVAKFKTAVKCSYSHIHLKRLLTDVIDTGIVCECGVVQIGDDVIQASTKFVTQKGGRIYVGAYASPEMYESEEYAGHYYRLINGQEEWINPPMAEGIEYRTVERYNNKPVYTMISPINWREDSYDEHPKCRVIRCECVVADNLLPILSIASNGTIDKTKSAWLEVTYDTENDATLFTQVGSLFVGKSGYYQYWYTY